MNNIVINNEGGSSDDHSELILIRKCELKSLYRKLKEYENLVSSYEHEHKKILAYFSQKSTSD
jgi:hypothetical protein